MTLEKSRGIDRAFSMTTLGVSCIRMTRAIIDIADPFARPQVSRRSPIELFCGRLAEGAPTI
jgi:hypothetical protein